MDASTNHCMTLISTQKTRQSQPASQPVSHLEGHEPEAVREEGRVPHRPLVRAQRRAVVVRGADLRDGRHLQGLFCFVLGREMVVVEWAVVCGWWLEGRDGAGWERESLCCVCVRVRVCACVYLKIEAGEGHAVLQADAGLCFAFCVFVRMNV